jgi:hypothetical protein
MIKAPETSYAVDRIETAPGYEEERIESLKQADDSNFEVFRRGEGTVDFRTVGWIHAPVISLKCMNPDFSSFSTIHLRELY